MVRLVDLWPVLLVLFGIELVLRGLTPPASGVRHLSLSGGAQHITLALGPPSGTVRVDVSGGASSVTIHRPTGGGDQHQRRVVSP
jgi:hypothetical protein